MLWVKAFHIIFVVSWFAGLFYLPRIFVNHAMATEPAEIARLKLMEGKLYRFMTPIAWLAAGFRDMAVAGLWLWRRLVACKTRAGAGSDRLSLLLRHTGPAIRRRPEHPQPCVLSLVQRNPGADPDCGGHPRHRQAVLTYA